MKIHRIASAIALATSSLGIFGLSPASADEIDYSSGEELVLLSDSDFDWLNRADAWIGLNWTTQTGIDNLEITASTDASHVFITYPDNTVDFSGPNNGPELGMHEVDYTAIFVETTWRAPDDFDVVVSASYTVDGNAVEQDFALSFHRVEWEGDNFVLSTDEIRIPADGSAEAGWVELDYIGLAPQLWKFRVEVSNDNVAIEHPQGDYTGLHHDRSLHVGERDVARVWIDPSQFNSGETHELEIETRFQTGEGNSWKSETLSVTLVVD